MGDSAAVGQFEPGVTSPPPPPPALQTSPLQDPLTAGGGGTKRKLDAASSSPPPPRRPTGFSPVPAPSRPTGFSSAPPPSVAVARPTGFSPAPPTTSSGARVTGFSPALTLPPPPPPPPAGSSDGQTPFELAKQRAEEIAARLVAQESKKDYPGSVGGGFGAPPANGSIPPPPSTEQQRKPSDLSRAHMPQDETSWQKTDFHNSQQQDGYNDSYGPPKSRRMDIPNTKVGILIGRGGETIKYLQQQSGARIQITRDADHDPSNPFRQVELMGTLEQINRAESLINEIIEEADAGGSGPNAGRDAARGPGTSAQGDQVLIKIPNGKVGLIIGRGGETIKSLQMRSGARIQLVQGGSEAYADPGATERTFSLNGSKQQIDSARALIKEILDQSNTRPPFQPGGPNNQRGFRPPGPPQWGQPAPPLQMQQPAFGYQQQQQQQQQGGSGLQPQQSGAYFGTPPQYSAPQQIPPPPPPPQQQLQGYPPQQQSSGLTPPNWDQQQQSSTQPPQMPISSDFYNQQGQTGVAASSDSYGQPQPQPQPQTQMQAQPQVNYSHSLQAPPMQACFGQPQYGGGQGYGQYAQGGYSVVPQSNASNGQPSGQMNQSNALASSAGEGDNTHQTMPTGGQPAQVPQQVPVQLNQVMPVQPSYGQQVYAQGATSLGYGQQTPAPHSYASPGVPEGNAQALYSYPGASPIPYNGQQQGPPMQVYGQQAYPQAVYGQQGMPQPAYGQQQYTIMQGGAVGNPIQQGQGFPSQGVSAQPLYPQQGPSPTSYGQLGPVQPIYPQGAFSGYEQGGGVVYGAAGGDQMQQVAPSATGKAGNAEYGNNDLAVMPESQLPSQGVQ